MVPPRPPQNPQMGPNTNAGGGRNVTLPGGPECFKCGQRGHMARECPGRQGSRQNMMADGAPDGDAPIAMQWPPNRVGFDVTRQSVQRPQPAQRAAPRSNPLEGDALLAQASIDVPLESPDGEDAEEACEFHERCAASSKAGAVGTRVVTGTTSPGGGLCHNETDARQRVRPWVPQR